jgi:proteasome lid subunit RPN8/RPN11
LAEKEVKELKVSVPRVFITPQAMQRLALYIHGCPDEISGLGRVERLGEDFLITEVFLFKQRATGASTELSEKDIAEWLTDLVRQGKDPSKIKLWWHSHASMGAYWSSTDEETVFRFSATDWMISLVGNKRGEYCVRLDIYKPIRLTLDGLPLEVYWLEDKELKAEVEKEIKEKVKRGFPLFSRSFYDYGYPRHSEGFRPGYGGLPPWQLPEEKPDVKKEEDEKKKEKQEEKEG